VGDEPIRVGRRDLSERARRRREEVRRSKPVSWVKERYRYQKLATDAEPVAVISTKDHWGWTALYVAVCALTLGLLAIGLSRRRFLDDFATTAVTRQGYPRAWPRLSNRVVVHESRHTTQAVAFGWWLFPIAWVNRRLRAWLGALPNAIVYGLLPLPIGLAAGRFYLELDADKAAWRRGLREGWLSQGEVEAHAKRRAATMSSGAYFWAWPGPWARKAYRAAALEIIEERLRG
jgi:hypothetical protein